MEQGQCQYESCSQSQLIHCRIRNALIVRKLAKRLSLSLSLGTKLHSSVLICRAGEGGVRLACMGSRKYKLRARGAVLA